MEEWGRLAWRASSESGLDDRPRCDPRMLAAGFFGLTLAPWPRTRARLVDGVIWYPSDETEDAQAFLVGHEIGHHMLDEAGIRLEGDELERACSTIAAELLLPERAYRRDLAAVGWDLPRLRELWPLASPWIHARRIVEVTGAAIASRWSARAMRDRVGPHGVAAPPLSTCVRDAAATALERGAAEVGDTCAWCIGGEVIALRRIDIWATASAAP